MSGERVKVPVTEERRTLLDDANVGVRDAWFREPPQDASSAVVAATEGIVWHFSRFSFPEVTGDYRAQFCVGVSGARVQIWLNGAQLADLSHFYGVYDFPAPGTLQATDNLLAFRLESRPCVASGLGTVEAKLLPAACLKQVLVLPDLRRKRVTIRATAAAPGDLHLQLNDLSADSTGESFEAHLNAAELDIWTPENPHLHTLRLRFLSGTGHPDTFPLRIGLREFSIKDRQFHLNHRPIFLRGIATVPPPGASEETLRKAVTAARDAGFNLLAVPVWALSETLLNLTDTLGMLVSAECALPDAEVASAEADAPLQGSMGHHGHHPSLILWRLRCGSLRQTELSALAVRLHQLDPSRVWLCTAGENEGGGSWFLRPHQRTFEACDAYFAPQRVPVSALSEYYYRQGGENSALLYLEGVRCSAETRVEEPILREGFEARQLERVFGDLDTFAAATQVLQSDALRFLMDALRANPRLGGYVVQQLLDTPEQGWGLMQENLAPKPSLKGTAKVHAAIRPLIYMQRKTLTPREEVSVTVLLANAAKLEGLADLSLQVVGPTNQVLWKKKRGAKIPRDGKVLWEGAIAASGSLGQHKFVVRLLQGIKVIAENAMEFLVLEEPVPADVPIRVIDPRNEWTEACGKLARIDPKKALIHVLPPLGNSIRAYPAVELAQLLGHVREGAVAIIFGPPDDWNDLAEAFEPSLCATSRDALGLRGASYHYAKLHPVFEGLPTRGLMRQPYRNVIPDKAFMETTDEDICGVYVREEEAWWGNNFLVRRYGSGRLVFTHMRVLHHLGFDPLADRLFVNLLNHFSRRSVPSETPPVNTRISEWLRSERLRLVRRWMVVGDFPNWRYTQGHNVAYSPENAVNLDAEYIGWYRIIRWCPCFSALGDQHTVDLQAMMRREHPDRAPEVPATAYAYAEFTAERRQEMLLHLRSPNLLKCWLNGILIAASDIENPVTPDFDLPCFTRQGRNTVLVKCSSSGGPFTFDFALEAQGRELPGIGWWK